MISATQIRVGNILIYKGDLCKVIKSTHITPGKGVACMQVIMRNLKTGNKIDNRFRPDEKIEKANLFEKEMEFLYDDSVTYHFMDPQSYEQIEVGKEIVGDAIPYLKPNIKITVVLHEEKPIAINPPQTVELKIIETDPPLKGATAAGGAKPAKLENGITIKVPQFIENGEMVRVDTTSNEYMERVK